MSAHDARRRPSSAPAPAEPASDELAWSSRGLALPVGYLQLYGIGEGLARSNDEMHRAAAGGVSGGGGPLPYAEAIQRSFGRHDVSQVEAHVGESARAANRTLGAEAYATGSRIAFAGTPTLHTAAHEAAHVVQQRGGVQLKGGVGQAGDVYERHADAVADRVVAGESAEPLLDTMSAGPSTASASTAIQLVLTAELATQGLSQPGSVDRLGGQTHGAYLVTTPQGNFVVKAMDDDSAGFAVRAAQLAPLAGVDTPEAVQIAASAVPKLAEQIGAKASVLVMQHVKGLGIGKASLDERGYKHLGRIAAFDMLIGKPDLFANHDPLEHGAENFNNVIIQQSERGAKVFDIDLSHHEDYAGPDQKIHMCQALYEGTKSMKNSEIIQEILDNPEVPCTYIKRNISDMLKLSTSHPKGMKSALYLQKGIVQAILRLNKDPEAVSLVVQQMPRRVQDMAAFYREVGQQCVAALDRITAKINRLSEPQPREEPKELKEPIEDSTGNEDKKEKKKKSKAKQDPCIVS
jgi:hypothetical protein